MDGCGMLQEEFQVTGSFELPISYRKNQNEKIEQIHVDDHDTLNKCLQGLWVLFKASPYQLVWILYIIQGSKFS